jgi:UPF0755 protein
VTGDWQEDWAEGPESPHPPPTSPPLSTPPALGRHSRRPQDYGDQDPYTPTDGYPQPDPYAAPGAYCQPEPYPGPDHSGQPDPYAPPGRTAQPDPYAPPDHSGQPDPYAPPGRSAQPDPYAPPDHSGQPDPYAPPGRSAQPDPYAPPGRSAQPDPLTAPGRFAPPDPLTAPGRFAPPDPLTAPGRHAPDRSAVTDPYATRPHRVQTPPEPGPPYIPPDSPGGQAYGQPAYPADEPYGGSQGRHGSRAAPRGRGDQNGHGRRDPYDPLTAPQGQNGYGPPGSFESPAEPGNQNGYGAVGYEQPDGGPFRWRPSPETPEPEGLAPLPDYHGGPDREPRPGPRDWDPGQERDWDPGPDDSAVGLAEPVSGPVDGGAWQREANAPDQRAERDARDERHDWDDASQGSGLVPGFGDTGSRRGRGGRPRRRVSRVLAPLLALVLLAALGAGGYKIYRHFQSPDFTGPGTGDVTVQVLPGDTATSLAPRLVKLGVVASTTSFVSAAKDSPNPAGLQPGFFRLHHHMNSAMAYALLLNPSSRIQSVVTIPEGQRATQILTTLEQKTHTPASAFTAALKDTAALGLPSYAKGNPEGYLFPATYDFNPGTSALTMLKAMVARYNQEAASINLTAAAKVAQLTPSQVITVASILEAEAGNPKYYADVAEVIYNRLNQGMFLGLDSTVNYALHRFGVSLTTTQLHVNSPYNTFIHLGLPPGPIDSPGNAAIEAALHPEHGDLLYFVTVNVKTGLTKFATTAAGFQQLENECNQNNSC